MNSHSSLRADVLIIGAGPVGLTLANLLGTFGVSTLIVERHESTVSEPRAVSLDDESLRTMQSAGLVDDVVRDVVLGYGVQYFSWRGRHFADVLPTRREYGYPKRNAFRQPLLEAALRKGLQRFSAVRALFRHELLDWQDTAEGVRARLRSPDGELEVQARWMIGCDGGRSGVRERCGIRLEGTTYAERWLIVDLDRRTTALRHTRTYCDPARPAIRLPGPDGTLRYEFMLRPGETDAFALEESRFRGWMAEREPGDADLPLVRKVVYTFHARMATRWRQGRVLLAGDAAHLTPPFAGQGLNSGLRDAANLAWKLAAVLHWGAPESLLDTYEQERRPHAGALIRMALRIGHFMQPRSRWGAMLSQTTLRLACLIPSVGEYILQLRFKPKPRFTAGFFEPAAARGGAGDAELLPQPLLELADRSSARLDDLLGNGFAVIGRAELLASPGVASWVPPGAPYRVVALKRADEDFLPGDDPAFVHARDGSGALDAFLAAVGAAALVVRPDRYWCLVIADDGRRLPCGWDLGSLRAAGPTAAAGRADLRVDPA